MSKYQRGLLYKLVCNKTGLLYVGSTIQSLTERKSKHLHDLKRWRRDGKRGCSAYKVIEAGDFDIILLEEYPCDTKANLRLKEQDWIEQLTCVNRNRAIDRSRDKEKEYHRQRRKDPVFKESQRQYDANRPMITCGCGGQYRKGLSGKHERTRKHRAWAADLSAEFS
jgi:hypothetical protein